MNTEAAIVAFEDALTAAVALGDSTVEEAAAALLQALRPAMDRLMVQAAEDAAEEVSAQLPDAEVQVVMDDGAPRLVVEQVESEVEPLRDELEARLTLRLPSNLKGLIEEAATEAGDSVNAHVIETLHRSLQRHRRGRRFSGTIET